jgi:hypothetical protein
MKNILGSIPDANVGNVKSSDVLYWRRAKARIYRCIAAARPEGGYADPPLAESRLPK